MRVSEIMTRGVESVAPGASLREAAQKMSELDVGPLPVVDGDRVVGMLTDRDITVRATAKGADPNTTCVRDAMTPDVIFVFEDEDVAEAGRLMKQKQVRRLLVLGRDRRLSGIVSLGDLAVDSGDTHAAGSALEGVSQPAEPNR